MLNLDYLLNEGYEIKDLSVLPELELISEDIESIDEKLFEACPNLEIVNLSYNKLTSLFANTFKRITNLSRLDLNNNQLESIDEKAFETCFNLKWLDLSNNKLKSINGNTFKKLANLIRLFLSDNQIESVDVGLFEACSNLKELDLHNNKLTSLHSNTFEKITELSTLNISKNGIVNELSLSFNSDNLELLNFSFNYINIIKLEFAKSATTSNQMLKLNISSNDIRQISNIQIHSDLTQFEINARFNLIQSLLFHEIFDGDKKINFQNVIKFDLSHNPLNTWCLQKISQSQVYKEMFRVKIQETSADRFIKRIKFDLIQEQYPHLKKIKNWNGISEFCVITGKNGVGKSTLLNSIKDYIQKLYNDDILSKLSISENDEGGFSSYFDAKVFFETKEKDEDEKNNTLQTEQTENRKKLRKNLFIPVVFKMHDKIKPDMVNVYELEQLAEEWYKKKNQNENWNEIETEVSMDIFNQVLTIFSGDSIENLILYFKNNIDRVNQHLHDFKYKIEINEAETDLQTDEGKDKSKTNNSPNVYFIDRENPETKISSANLSPGEQLILMFRLWEFALRRYEIPHTPVLLLDEPDAHLHPKAVRDFVDILRKLADAGAQVIMTTHNPTTVSFIPHENLYCMKKIEGSGEIVIEKAKSKADIVRELTSNLLVVSDNYRTVLVEGKPLKMDTERIKYNEVQRDSIFYQNILIFLSESGFVLQNQYLFKSFTGCTNILTFMKSLDHSKIYQDHLAIIDNDNYLRIVSNQDGEISEYYDNIVLMSDVSSEFDGKVKNVYNLLRHSFENYALDPVNLFCYLNFIQSRDQQTSDLRVDKVKLEELYKRIIATMKIDKSDLEKMKHLINVKNMIKNGQIGLVQSIISSIGELIVEYLCEKEANLNHRLFNYSEFSYLQNFIPIFRFIIKKENSYRRRLMLDKIEDQFCSVCFSLNLDTKRCPNDFIAGWMSRKNLLKDTRKEENEKNIEFENVKELFKKLNKISEPLKSFRNGKLNKCLDVLNHLRVDNTICQDELDDVNISFPDIKAKVDEELIGKVRRTLLDETINCCFAGHQQIVFKYPKIFYYLNGHFFEKIIYSMFFDQSTQFKISILIDKIVRDDGLMNECGYLVPNDLCEIFKRIDSFKTPTDSTV